MDSVLNNSREGFDVYNVRNLTMDDHRDVLLEVLLKVGLDIEFSLLSEELKVELGGRVDALVSMEAKTLEVGTNDFIMSEEGNELRESFLLLEVTLESWHIT
jgi:hypothetical protein